MPLDYKLAVVAVCYSRQTTLLLRWWNSSFWFLTVDGQAVNSYENKFVAILQFPC